MGAQPVYEQAQTQAVTYAQPSVVYETPQVTYAAPAAQPVYEQQQAVTYALPGQTTLPVQTALPAQTSVYEQQYQQPAVQYAASTTQPVYEQSQQVMYTGGAPMQATSFAVPGQQMSYATAASTASMAMAAPAASMMAQPTNLSFIPPAMQPQMGYQQEQPGMASACYGGSPAVGMTGMGMMQQSTVAEGMGHSMGMEPAVAEAPVASMPMAVQEPAPMTAGVKGKKSKKLVTKKTRKDCC